MRAPNAMWTPYDIEVVLHHYVSPAPFEREDAPAYEDVVRRLTDLGIIAHNGTRYKTTPLGEGLIKLWLCTPLPVYVDPRLLDRAEAA